MHGQPYISYIQFACCNNLVSVAAAHYTLCSKIRSKKSPASDAGNVREPRMISQFWDSARSRVRVAQCFSAVREMKVSVSAVVAAAIVWLREKGREFRDTRAGGCHGKCQGLLWISSCYTFGVYEHNNNNYLYFVKSTYLGISFYVSFFVNPLLQVYVGLLASP